jgi:hypothetical protein
MLGTDTFGRGFLKTLEFPSQVAAVGTLMLALLVSNVEIQRGAPAADPLARITRGAMSRRWGRLREMRGRPTA